MTILATLLLLKGRYILYSIFALLQAKHEDANCQALRYRITVAEHGSGLTV